MSFNPPPTLTAGCNMASTCEQYTTTNGFNPPPTSSRVQHLQSCNTALGSGFNPPSTSQPDATTSITTTVALFPRKSPPHPDRKLSSLDGGQASVNGGGHFLKMSESQMTG